MATGYGTRGKWAEDKVRQALTTLSTASNFTFHRFADARAGFKQDAPADFMLLNEGHVTLLEVKEVDHAFRLPYKNFESEQVSRMRVWSLAGASVAVLVLTKQAEERYNRSTSRVWRLAPLEFYLERPVEPAPGQKRATGSWNLTPIVPTTLEEAIANLFKRHLGTPQTTKDLVWNVFE